MQVGGGGGRERQCETETERERAREREREDWNHSRSLPSNSRTTNAPNARAPAQAKAVADRAGLESQVARLSQSGAGLRAGLQSAVGAAKQLKQQHDALKRETASGLAQYPAVANDVIMQVALALALALALAQTQ